MVSFIVVTCFIGGDIISGVLKGTYNGELNSTKLRKGLFHKLSEFLAVGVCYLLEYGAGYFQFGFDIPLLRPVVCYICLMELISIIENICAMNPQLKKLFKPYLEKFNNEEEDKDNEPDGC